jgi:endoglucanase
MIGKNGTFRTVMAVSFLTAIICLIAQGDEIFVRANQLGYSPHDPKCAVAFSETPLPSEFTVENNKGALLFRGKNKALTNATWGKFKYHADLDFSSLHSPGTFVLKVGQSTSLPFHIGNNPYEKLPDELLDFMREQQCGFNPWLELKCHQLDGRTAYGPRPAGTPLDVTGGWHDAGDMLKYLVTSEDATANMLLAYQLGSKSLSSDQFNALGQPGSNGIPDLLDEAKWGLDWMLKMHPSPNELYHQVADDRDHAGWRLPPNDQANYGWGKAGARVVYFADGHPQGLKKYQSESTGIANLAGVYSAAMALAFEIWKDDPTQKDFAAKCLQAGKEVYEIGRTHEGVQQGNSYGAPYRYGPTIWACDMEWGAAELYRTTHEQHYLDEAKHYATLAADENWMGKAQTAHYQYFPFTNVGHYRLYDLVDPEFQKQLAGYYRAGIERCIPAGQTNPYHIGIPFIWCSNNLAVALVTQLTLYEQMTGDMRYCDFAAKQRDWLLGRNPWGTTMFTEIGQVFPTDVHLMTVQLLKRPVRGALVDGPVYDHIFKSLYGVSIHQPDPLAAFQGPAVYHNDYHDYSSNEPTLDGTASAILMFSLCNAESN